MQYFEGFIELEPYPKERPRYSQKTRKPYTPFKTKKYELDLSIKLKVMFGENLPMEGAISAQIVFYLTKPKSISKKRKYPMVKPDLDNLCKSFFDACEKGGILVNDSRIVDQIIKKRYAEGMNPGIEFIIQTLP